MVKFFNKKKLNYNIFNEIFDKNLLSLTKIYGIEKISLEGDYEKQMNNFHQTIENKNNLIYFVDVKIKDNKFTIGFFHNIKIDQKKFRNNKFLKDSNSFVFLSDDKIFFSDINKDAQFCYIDKFFFIVGFNNGGGVYLRKENLVVNFNKLSKQFILNEKDKLSSFLKDYSEKNLYQYFSGIEVYEVNSKS